MEDGASLQVEAICEKSQEASGEEVDEPAVSRGATPSETLSVAHRGKDLKVPDGRREGRKGEGRSLTPLPRTVPEPGSQAAREWPGKGLTRQLVVALPRKRDGRCDGD